MRLFMASLQNELSKLLSRKKYIVFVIIEAAICLISVLTKLLIAKVSQGNLSLSLQNIPINMMSFFVNILIPLIVFMAVTDLFGTEFQDSTIKALLSRPVSRMKIFTSKITAAFVLGVVNLICVFVVSAALEALTTGNVAQLGYSLSAYLLDIIPMLVVVLMAAFINQFGKSSTMAMFLCIIVYVVLWVGGVFVPQLSGLLFSGYLQWHKLWLGTLLPVSAIVSKIALLAGYSLVFFSGGYYLFLKREI